jgi:NADH:ubiquinone oxidoreductase subunit E
MSLWPADVQERAKELIGHYPDPKSAVMPLLYLAMRHDGYLTQAGMQEVATWTGHTPAQIQSVATFYGMFKTEPIGNYLVSVCTSISCMLLGGDDVLEAVEDETGVPHGETDSERLFSVEHVECLGACGGAPAVQVNYELIEGSSPDRARALCRWLRDERPESVNTDDMQNRFGGRRSFDWAIPEERGAVGPFPAFGPYGTVREGNE